MATSAAEITFRNMDPNAELEKQICEQIAKLGKCYDRVIDLIPNFPTTQN